MTITSKEANVAWATEEGEDAANMADSVMFQLGGKAKTSAQASVRQGGHRSPVKRPQSAPMRGRGDNRNNSQLYQEASQKLTTAKLEYEAAFARRTASLGHSNRYDASRHNVLKGVDRIVKPESLRLRKIGVDGLGR